MIRLPGIWDPAKIMFDEVAGMTYSLHILYGKPYFDVHPPLVDLIYTVLIGPFHPSFVNKISDNDHQFGNFPFVWVRIVTAVAGSIIPVLMMIIAWELFGRRLVGVAVGLAAVFDNMLVLYSRLMLPDIWLLLFGLGAVAVVLKQEGGWKKGLGVGFLLAATVGVKWTGLGFWAVVLGFLIAGKQYKKLATTVSGGVMGYVLIWMIFFGSLRPGTAFSGIEAYSGRLVYPDGRNLVDIVKYLPRHQLYMLAANDLLVKHEAASAPPLWIFGGGKIPVFTDENRIIVMLGNLVGWWGVMAGLVCGIGLAVRDSKLQVLILAYLANFLPFLFIRRVFFVYHYLPALTVGYLVLAGTLVKFGPKFVKLWLVVVVVGFLAVAPVTYGWRVPLWWIKWLAN